MSTPNCDTGRQPSRIPGNIGTLKSKVVVWDHDPFWARPTQIYSFPFSQATGEQMREPAPDIQFEVGSAFLRPTFRHHDMFVCTLNKDRNAGGFSTVDGKRGLVGETTINPEVDFVGSVESGVGLIAAPRMPGGDIYECDGGNGGDQTSDSVCAVTLPNGEVVNAADETTGKSIFSHQVWRHEGSLFRDKPLIHPSEYQKPLSELQQARNADDNPDNDVTIDDLQSAAKWDYIEVADNGKLSIWPVMITKQSPNLKNTVHWTLEKWTPVWQGQDFYVTIRLGDKRTDDAVDPNNDTDATRVKSLAEAYFPYLWYDVERDGSNTVPGITNQAFHIFPQKDNVGVVSEEARSAATRAARKAYDWRYQTYILIEIGAFSLNHNYFIELVKGRNPRFLHLGEEWDNPDRLEVGVNANPAADNAGFTYMKKCRELSVFPGVKCDQLFRQRDFRVNVRNHLGRLVVTFEGYESQPWVINRLDNDPRKTDFTKTSIPMVVPSALMRLHGGNISCAVNYSPTEYRPIATIPFVNRQVDTGPDNSSTKAKNKDIFLTFSHMGNAIQHSNSAVRTQFFSDDRFLYDKVGYDCDAFVTHEKNKNKTVSIEIYKKYDKQYRIYGKGWYNETPREESDDQRVQRDPITLRPLQPIEVNGMDPKKGGTPSHLKIINARDPSSEFPLSLTEGTDEHYEWKEFVAKWDVGIEFKAGSIKLNSPTGDRGLPIVDAPKAKVFANYATPIATSWRLIVLGGGKPFEGSVVPFDISPLVSKITDSWSSEDFFSLSHEMQMECYIPIESTSNENQNTVEDQELLNTFALGRKLLPLHDRAFYITVSYWWNTGIGHRWVESNELNREGEDPIFNDALIQMTGVAYGAQLIRSNNRLFMSFTVKDYMSVLENQFIFNSPFFDGVQDVQAVYELAKLAGFADESNRSLGIDRKPLGYLRKVMDDGDRVGERLFTYNGEKSRSERYDLKGTYSSLAEPTMRFQNGETYESAIKRMAQMGSKVVYFDRWGVLRMETPSALIAATSSVNDNIEFVPVFDFVTTPIVRKSNIPDPDGEQNNNFSFDPRVHAAHLVYNSVTYQRSVEDCANQIIILSASNNIKKADGSTVGGFIIEGYTFFDQIWKPESEGFIGYRKPLYQSEGAFGSVEAVRNAIRIYAKRKFPPVIMTFETYGVPGLKALDIITLDGNLAYITELSHDLDPATNKWWMNVTAEWLKPIKGELGFLETFEPNTGGQQDNNEG